MYLIGLSWIVTWLLIDVFNVETLKAFLVTGLIFLVLGLIIDKPWVART